MSLADRPVASAITTQRTRRQPSTQVRPAGQFLSVRALLEPRWVQFALVDDRDQDWRPPWVPYTEVQLTRLLALPKGWDGRWAEPVTESAMRIAVAVLAGVMTDDGACPQLFPLPDGGIQVEWHAAGEDVEVEIERDGSAHALVVDATGEVTVEGEFSPSTRSEPLEGLRAAVQRVSERVAAAR